MISPAENSTGEKQPDRIDIFDAALATYVSTRDACPEVAMEKIRTIAAKIGCEPQRILDDVQFIHDLIRNMRKQIMEGSR